MIEKKRALFLDRDGILNKLIFNPKTEAYESPHDRGSLQMLTRSYPFLHEAMKRGFELFVVSNQPSYAKGKTTLEEIKAIAADVAQNLKENKISIREFFYCYHHPDGIVPEFSGTCQCRKPKPYFLLQAAERHDLDLSKSWMIGDQDTDVECGQKAGCQTALVHNPHSAAKRGIMKPTFIAKDLAEALESIFNRDEGEI